MKRPPSFSAWHTPVSCEITSCRLNATSTVAEGSGMRTPSCTTRTRFGGPPRRPMVSSQMSTA
jgi:hypothetical protein